MARNYSWVPSPLKMKIWWKTTKTEILNFDCSIPVHKKSKKCLKYFVHYYRFLWNLSKFYIFYSLHPNFPKYQYFWNLVQIFSKAHNELIKSSFWCPKNSCSEKKHLHFFRSLIWFNVFNQIFIEIFLL